MLSHAAFLVINGSLTTLAGNIYTLYINKNTKHELKCNVICSRVVFFLFSYKYEHNNKHIPYDKWVFYYMILDFNR